MKIEFILTESLDQIWNKFNNEEFVKNLIFKKWQTTTSDSYFESLKDSWSFYSKEDINQEIKNMKEDLLEAVASFPERLQSILVSWLIKNILNNNVKWEDIYKAKEYLENFYKYKDKIKQKDITKYNTLQEIFLAYKPFIQKEMGLKDPKAVENTKVIYEDENYLIMSPLTQEASCILGQGTEWCTAADPKQHYNYFEQYAEQSPLYILFNKKTGERTQYHAADNQMMDEGDNPIVNVQFFELIKKLGLHGGETEIKELMNGGLRIGQYGQHFFKEYFYNKEGRLHRLKGPAYITDYSKKYFIDGIDIQAWVPKDNERSFQFEQEVKEYLKKHPEEANLMESKFKLEFIIKN